jgi:archaeosine-15-forming tRNA-guanine transglycosylase
LPTLSGAGALQSSANDLLNLLAAQLAYTKSPLMPAMERMLSVRRPAGPQGTNMNISLAWHINTGAGDDVIWHNGGTGGYRSFIGYDPKTRVGIVVLSNASTVVGVDDIGSHLVNQKLPLLPPTSPILQPPKERTEITMAPEKFDVFAGRYQFTPEVVLTISRQDTHFYGQLTGQPRYEIFAESERDFFFKVTDAQLKFEVDASGRSTSVLLYQLGRIQRATRFEGEPQLIWFGHKQNAVDPAVYDRYVARYQLTPAVVITITREDNRLYGQLTGQPRIEIFPEGERDYFLKVIDAQITFEQDAAARVTAAVLHQNLRDQRAPRIE